MARICQLASIPGSEAGGYNWHLTVLSPPGRMKVRREKADCEGLPFCKAQSKPESRHSEAIILWVKCGERVSEIPSSGVSCTVSPALINSGGSAGEIPTKIRAFRSKTRSRAAKYYEECHRRTWS